jgi:hypothetical protein
VRPIVFNLPHAKSAEDAVKLIPLSCAHFPLGEKKLLLEWREEVSKPKTYTILIGDMFDQARGKFRNHVRSYRMDANSQLAIDAFVRKEVEDFAKILKPISSRVIGLVWGNHRWEFATGLTSDQYLCELLKIPFLGVEAFVRLRFEGRDKTRGHILKMYAHHDAGTRSARTRGGDMTSLQRKAVDFDADIFVAGHTHRAMGDIVDILALSDFGEPAIITRPRAFIRAGTLVKSRRLDMPSPLKVYMPEYPEHSSLGPSDLGWEKLSIWFVRHGEHGNERTQTNMKIERSTC